MTDIRAERIGRSMTQKRLAHLAGVDARTVRKIEKGETVSLDTRHAVYAALGVDPVSSTVAPAVTVDHAPLIGGVKETSLFCALFAAAATGCRAALVYLPMDRNAEGLVSFFVLAMTLGALFFLVMAMAGLRSFFDSRYDQPAALRKTAAVVVPVGAGLMALDFLLGRHGLYAAAGGIAGIGIIGIAALSAVDVGVAALGTRARRA